MAAPTSIDGLRPGSPRAPRVTLLDALREHLHLYGTKKGCDHGQWRHADITTVDASFIDEPDLLFKPIGCRGIGEIGNPGTAAANAVYNATGKRVRSLPITVDKLLRARSEP